MPFLFPCRFARAASGGMGWGEGFLEEAVARTRGARKGEGWGAPGEEEELGARDTTERE